LSKDVGAGPLILDVIGETDAVVDTAVDVELEFALAVIVVNVELLDPLSAEFVAEDLLDPDVDAVTSATVDEVVGPSRL
jgi:hypothetical protein